MAGNVADRSSRVKRGLGAAIAGAAVAGAAVAAGAARRSASRKENVQVSFWVIVLQKIMMEMRI